VVLGAVEDVGTAHGAAEGTGRGAGAPKNLWETEKIEICS
jgi:hypothetical protein